jgi:hypothetical protein
MALITSVSDPSLWATLNAKWQSEGSTPGWVVYENVHYKISFDTSGGVQFSSQTTLDYVDSRSLIGSKPATYKKIELE